MAAIQPLLSLNSPIPRAVGPGSGDRAELGGIHLRATNPIASTFATVRLRQRVTKRPGSRAAGVAMAFKLVESAQCRWRAVNAPHLVALVRAGGVRERQAHRTTRRIRR